MSGPPEGLVAGGRFAVWTAPATSAVVLDLDGTTLDRGDVASERVAAAHRAARAAGLGLHLATGRLPTGTTALLAQLGHTGPDVVHNGAAVVEDEHELATWPLPGAAAAELVAWCLAEELYAELYVGRGFWVTDRRASAQPLWDEISGPPDGLVAELDAAAAGIVKATVTVAPGGSTDPVVAVAQRLGLTAELSTAPALPGAGIVNITAPGVTKGRALGWLAEHHGLDLATTAAVGDGPNDLSMLARAGTAVAMADAPAEVRAAAHLVAPGVGDDGAAVVLELAAAGLLHR
ncbi:Cof-type HAD-IIB family hydrolase [Rhodococcus aerolatus]